MSEMLVARHSSIRMTSSLIRTAFTGIRNASSSSQGKAIDLYMVPPSPPCRSVLLLGKKIGVQLNPITINLMKGEQHKPEFIAMNPEHTLPTIVDHNTGLTLWESRAILSYLVDKYAPGDPLYPQDPVKRARIDRWLYFDCGSLTPAGLPIIRSLLYGTPKLTAEMMETLNEKYQLFDTLLAKDGTKFAAGDELTIADLTLVATLDMPVFLLPLDVSKYKNVQAWYKRVQASAVGYDEICVKVLTGFKKFLDKKKAAH